MLLTSSFILNDCHGKEIHEIAPQIHNTNNTIQESDLFTRFKFPDVNPSDLISDKVEFSMAAGEFVNVYGEEHCTWDVIATSFFIDTAHNIVEYVETIYNLLKPGGYWINLGPLLYHYSDDIRECSIELSWELLKKLIVDIGFEILVIYL